MAAFADNDSRENSVFEERMRIFNMRGRRNDIIDDGLRILNAATNADVDAMGKWGERESVRRDERDASEQRKHVVRDLFPTQRTVAEDGRVIEDVDGPSAQQTQDIASIVTAWIEELEDKFSAYSALPANNANNIVGYLRSEDMIQEASELERQTNEYADFQRKIMNAAAQMPAFMTFLDEEGAKHTMDMAAVRDGSVALTPKQFEQFKTQYASSDVKPIVNEDGSVVSRVQLGEYTAPSARDAILDLRTKMDNHTLPDIPEVASPTSAQAVPSVKEFINNGNSFTRALTNLHSDNFDREAFKEQLRDGFREMASNAYDAADGPHNDEYKKRFVDAFVDDQERYIGMLSQNYVDGPRDALDHKLADYALVTEHPEVIANALRSTYTSGKRYLADEPILIGDEPLRDTNGNIKYNTQPESNALTLTVTLTSNISTIRSQVEHMALMNGETLGRAESAGANAIADIIFHGNDPDGQHIAQVLAKNAETYPPAPKNYYVRDVVSEKAASKAKRELQGLLDFDFNGRITREEAVAHMASKVDKDFLVDDDQDGNISVQEAKKAEQHLVAKADKNHDGKLDAAEVMRLQDTVCDRSGVLAQILEINGLELAAITRALKEKRITGGDEVKISTTGTHAEGQTTASLPTIKQSSKSTGPVL